MLLLFTYYAIIIHNYLMLLFYSVLFHLLPNLVILFYFTINFS